jgi:hypothetical protein
MPRITTKKYSSIVA